MSIYYSHTYTHVVLKLIHTQKKLFIVVKSKNLFCLGILRIYTVYKNCNIM